MGVHLTCQKTKRSIALGSIGFAHLRMKVAEVASSEFGQLINKTYFPQINFENKEEKEAYYDSIDQEIKNLIDTKKVSIKIVDFCLQSDCEGKIRYGACKKILEAFGDYDDNYLYGYAGRADCVTIKIFKEFLQECVNSKCDMKWS